MSAVYVASAVGGALIGSLGSRGAASSQSLAAQQAAGNQMAMFYQQQANMQPWLRAGGQAVGQMGALMAPGGAMATAPTAQDIMQYMAPNYQFQLQQGLGQAGAQANASGGLVSGNALQGLNQFAQNYAQGAYQNAFQNYQTAQTNIFNRLASIAGLGQTSAGQTMTGGMGAAGAASNFATSGAAAQAAGQIGAANAFNQGLGQIGGMAYMNYLRSQQPQTTVDPSTGMQMSTTLSSDPKVKENIVKVGKTRHGLNLYKWNYIWDKSRKYIGVMSNEVEKIFPDAVIKGSDHDRVRYDLLGINMIEVINGN